MPYKISGFLESSARILVFKEEDWSIEYNNVLPPGPFEISSLSSGKKLVAGRKISDGYVEAYGNIDPIEYSGEFFLAINTGGDLLLINDAGDKLVIGVGN